MKSAMKPTPKKRVRVYKKFRIKKKVVLQISDQFTQDVIHAISNSGDWHYPTIYPCAEKFVKEVMDSLRFIFLPKRKQK